ARRGTESVVRAFATACGTGSPSAVRGLLTQEATVISDGGGVVAAALQPGRGARPGALWLTELLTGDPGTAPTLEAVNGQAGVVLRRDGAVVGVMSLRVTGAKVADVWIVLNPDKLRHWV